MSAKGILKVTAMVASVLAHVYYHIRVVRDTSEIVTDPLPERENFSIHTWIDAMDVLLESYVTTTSLLVRRILGVPQAIGSLIYVVYVVTRANIEEFFENSFG